MPVSFERRWDDNAVHDSFYPKGDEKTVAYLEGAFLAIAIFDKSGIKPLFPFGFGLSYTTFAYQNLNVSSGASTHQSVAVTVSFDVTNTGQRAGAEVAQVYVGDQHSGVPRPPKKLKGFSKILLNAGETKQIAITLDQRAFSYYDVAGHQWKLTPGDFDIYVGPSSGQIALTGKTTLATAIASGSMSKF